MLVDLKRYRSWTGDQTTSDDDVADALIDAERLVGEECNRILPYDTYTETLYVYRDGRVYPSATPLASVADPDGAVIDGPAILFASGLSWPILFDGAVPPMATVTYTGGYNALDGDNPRLPLEVGRAIAQIAYASNHPSQITQAVPAGAKSASIGDVSFTGAGLTDVGLIHAAGVDKTIARFRRQTVLHQRAR